MEYNEDKIHKYYTDYSMSDNKQLIITKYVMDNRQSHANLNIVCDSKREPVWAVTDIYRFYYQNNTVEYSNKIEIYYDPKKDKDDDYNIASIKTFLMPGIDYRTDFYNPGECTPRCRAIELGGTSNPNYKRYEWDSSTQAFICYNDRYQGTLKDNKLVQEMFNVVTKLNVGNLELVPTIEPEKYAENKVYTYAKVLVF